MAFKGTAAKSASGAAMSKYDVDVEKRWKALESQAHPDRCNAASDGDLAERVSIIEAVLRKVDMIGFEKLAAQERVERGWHSFYYSVEYVHELIKNDWI